MMPNDNEMVKGKIYAVIDGEYCEVMELQGEITLSECDEQLWQYDYVRVVRCKDCRYYDYPFPDPKENADADPERWCCLLGMGGAFGENDYCSHGERRINNA